MTGSYAERIPRGVGFPIVDFGLPISVLKHPSIFESSDNVILLAHSSEPSSS